MDVVVNSLVTDKLDVIVCSSVCVREGSDVGVVICVILNAGLELGEFIVVAVFDTDDDGDDEPNDVIVYIGVIDGVCVEISEAVWVTVCSELDDWLKVE